MSARVVVPRLYCLLGRPNIVSAFMGAEVACRQGVAVEQLGPVKQNCVELSAQTFFAGPIAPTHGCFDAVYGGCSEQADNAAVADSVSEVATAQGPSGFFEAAGQVMVPSAAMLATALAYRYAPRAYSAAAAETAIDRAVASNLAESLMQKVTADYMFWHKIHPLFNGFRRTVKTAPENGLAFSKGKDGLLVRIHNGTEYQIPLRAALRLIEKLESLVKRKWYTNFLPGS